MKDDRLYAKFTLDFPDHQNPPSNLVAACRDCNAGKSSSSPDAPLVEQVNEDAIRWARAMDQVIAQRAADRAGQRKNHAAFRRAWNSWTYSNGKHFDLDADWRTTIDRHLSNGLDMDDLKEFIDVAMSAKTGDPWKYFNGCCWRRLEQIQSEVAAVVRAEEPRRTSTPEHWTEPEIAGMRQRAAAERADQMGVYPEEAVEAAMRVIHPHSEHADCGESFCMAIATGILLGRIRADKFVGDV